MFWTPKVQLFFRLFRLVQFYFALIHIVSQESLLYLKESEEATIAGHPLGVGSVWISTYFLFYNLATYCRSLLGLRYNIFFVILFLCPALIFACMPMTHIYLLHVFRFSTNPLKKALKKRKKKKQNKKNKQEKREEMKRK